MQKIKIIIFTLFVVINIFAELRVAKFQQGSQGYTGCEDSFFPEKTGNNDVNGDLGFLRLEGGS